MTRKQPVWVRKPLIGQEPNKVQKTLALKQILATDTQITVLISLRRDRDRANAMVLAVDKRTGNIVDVTRLVAEVCDYKIIRPRNAYFAIHRSSAGASIVEKLAEVLGDEYKTLDYKQIAL